MRRLYGLATTYSPIRQLADSTIGAVGHLTLLFFSIHDVFNKNKKAPTFLLELVWVGDDLLSQVLPSTIGAVGLNFSVRDGKR